MGTLIRREIKKLLRDRLMLPLFLLPVLVYVGLPPAYAFVEGHWTFSWMEWPDRQLILLWFGFTPAYLMAFVASFSLLQDGDEGLLCYLYRTPLRVLGTWVAKLLPYFSAMWVYNVLILWGWFFEFSISLRLLLLLLFQLLGMSLILFLWRLSPDQVRGLVVAKITGFLWLSALLLPLAPHPWKWLGALIPLGPALLGAYTSQWPLLWGGLVQATIYFVLLILWCRRG